ncbi:TPA: amidohydrolase [Candidatus Poribacteria bacterium]|nr:amidohydrolase [Candidatus Poribacteria bacterium]
MQREELKKKLCEAIDRRREQIISIGEQIMNNPELGFKEVKTAKLVSETLGQLGIPHQDGLAITGVKGLLRCAKPGPTLALMGELDALVVFDHPMANKETGAAHACGHNAQIAGLMGAAMAMVDTKAAEELAGNVVFFAVPAEEYVEIEYRMNLVTEGKLEFLGGKAELVRLGHVDDIDLAMLIHASSNHVDKLAGIADSSNGCIVKLIRFIGRAAHAGGAPDKGINALNAAMVAMSAIHAQRETFRDDDTVRVHPIITHGGDLVNVIPSDVRMETYVRGKKTEAIDDANMKVDRALRAGAMAVGAKVEIQTLPGYLPQINNPDMAELFKNNVTSLIGADEFAQGGHRTGSTDMGDICHIMPAIHPYIGGAEGTGHSMDWRVADPDIAYVTPAKVLAMTAVDLLYDDAQKAKEILQKTKPRMTKEEYLQYQRNTFRTELFGGEEVIGVLKESLK